MARDYNLFELHKLCEAVFSSHPLVNNFMYDVYRLNDTDDILYPVVVMTVNNVTRNAQTLQFNCNFLYSDRLNDRRDNCISIQSTGISILSEGFNALASGPTLSISEGYNFTPFTEQFADNTAGVFAPVTFEAPSYIGDCHWFDIDKCFKCG